jgi:hypothetical protein
VTVFKFVEHPENNERPMEQKSKVKFKIVSLKVKGPTDYVPELVSCLIIIQLNMSFIYFPFSLFSSISYIECDVNDFLAV